MVDSTKKFADFINGISMAVDEAIQEELGGEYQFVIYIESEGEGHSCITSNIPTEKVIKLLQTQIILIQKGLDDRNGRVH